MARRQHSAMLNELNRLPPEPPYWPPGDGNDEAAATYHYWDVDTKSTRQKIEELAVATVLTSCAAVELYINDAGARLLGQKFFDDNLERLSLEVKWTLVPRLIANYEINKGSRANTLLLNLIRVRNKLMHPKSLEYNGKHFEEQQANQIEGSIEHLIDSANKAIAALDELYKESVNWNEQPHSIHHLWGKEHPLFEKEHWKLLIAAQDAREHQAAKPDVHNSEAFVPPSRVPTEDRESSSPADGASTRER